MTLGKGLRLAHLNMEMIPHIILTLALGMCSMVVESSMHSYTHGAVNPEGTSRQEATGMCREIQGHYRQA